MPIFSYRSLRRMFDDLSPFLNEVRRRELREKIRRKGDESVPAEWEIVVGYALSTQGQISDPGESRPGNPDFLFRPRDTEEQIVVEVTSLSDRNAKARNPVEDFSSELGKIAIKHGITSIGAFEWHVGDTEEGGHVVLGIPSRKDLPAFFKRELFRRFIAEVKAAPTAAHSYAFVEKGCAGQIRFAPGKEYMSGGYRGFDGARRPQDSGVLNRLKEKEEQLSKANFKLPALVVLCDNDSRVMGSARLGSSMFGGLISVDVILKAFFNGMAAHQSGSWIQHEPVAKRAKHIHAVAALTIHESTDLWAEPRRRVEGKLIAGPDSSDYMQSRGFSDLLRRACAALPEPTATPMNAMRKSRLPVFFGGGSMTDKSVKISLLTLQQLMVGKISHSAFLEGHGDLARHLNRLEAEGRMISEIKIEHQEGKDDDWAHVIFGQLQPDRLFDA